MEVKRSFFAEQLRKIMFEKKLTQQKLADMTGINRPLISRWIIGDRNPSLTSLKKIANVLDVSVEYFIENGKECIRGYGRRRAVHSVGTPGGF